MADEWKDRYEPDKVKEYYDLEGEQTAWVESQFDMTDDDAREQYESIETQFIDELYGTDNAEWATQNQDEGAFWNDDSGFDSTWGMDLRRTMLDEDGETINASHPEYYEHLTRGEVDWASYQNDTKFQEAFEDMKDEGLIPEVGPQHKDFTPGQIDFLTSKQTYRGSTLYKDTYKADLIRSMKDYMKKKESDEDTSHEDWEGKYDADKIYRDGDGNLFKEGKEQPTLKDLWTSDDPKGRLKVNQAIEHTKILKRRKVGPPQIPGVSFDSSGKPSLKNPTKLKLPGNIPKSWVKK